MNESDDIEEVEGEDPALVAGRMIATIKNIESARKNGVRHLRYPIGSMTEMTGGMKPGQLVIIGGRPGSGKTSLALNIAADVALQQSTPTMVVSYEAKCQ